MKVFFATLFKRIRWNKTWNSSIEVTLLHVSQSRQFNALYKEKSKQQARRQLGKTVLNFLDNKKTGNVLPAHRTFIKWDDEIFLSLILEALNWYLLFSLAIYGQSKPSPSSKYVIINHNHILDTNISVVQKNSNLHLFSSQQNRKFLNETIIVCNNYFIKQ